MTLQEIKTAIQEGKNVFWSSESYQVIKDTKNQYLIKHTGGHCIGLTWEDGVTLNGKPEQFFIKN
jgi:hypothetical protein